MKAIPLLHSLSRCLACGFLLIFIPVASQAGEKAVTVERGQYVGVGYSENRSEKLAKQDACNEARRELIGFIFGTAFQINQNMVRSVGMIDYSQDVSVNSGEVLIRGATIETSTESRLTKCKISYPTEEAELEKERLKSATFGPKHTAFTQIGDTENLKVGVLEIVSTPPGVEVLIDNTRWGVTPIRLIGQLTLGSHLLRLESAEYKAIEESFDVTSGTTRLNKFMTRATGALSIVTEPAGAEVRINNQSYGASPLNNLELEAGQNLTIEIGHPEAETYSQSLRLERDEERMLRIKLPLKPAYVSINTDPSDAVIRVNDRQMPNNHWNQLAPGHYEVRVSRDGYAESAAAFDISGGERKALPTFRLSSKSEVAATHESHLASSPWTSGVSVGWSAPSLKGDISNGYSSLCGRAGKRFFGFLALDLSICTDDAESQPNASGKMQYKMVGLSAQLSASVFFAGGFYLKPSYGILSHSYTVTQPGRYGAVESTFTVRQKFRNLSLGYEFRAGRCFFPVEVGYVRYEDDKVYKGNTGANTSIGFVYAY